MRYVLSALVILASGLAPAFAGDRNKGIGDRPGVGEPLRFRDASGGAFQPTELVVVVPGGALRAPLPEAVSTARNEDRIDLSGTPVIGGVFQETLSPGDARDGEAVGPVYRRGSRLIVDTEGASPEFGGSSVVLTSDLPRLGSVSYTLGPLDFRNGGGVLSTGEEPIGQAYMLDGRLVIASEGGGPAWGSVSDMLQGWFD
ncbi:MAG: hypothetical protein AAGH68_05100 [Pseudomonadota bacterium]